MVKGGECNTLPDMPCLLLLRVGGAGLFFEDSPRLLRLSL